jgi:hypothetical protein
MSERFNGSRPLSAARDDGPKAALREADPGWERATDALGCREGLLTAASGGTLPLARGQNMAIGSSSGSGW